MLIHPLSTAHTRRQTLLRRTRQGPREGEGHRHPTGVWRPTQALVRLRPEAPQGGDHMPGRARKTSRQFEKDKAAFFAQCKAQHAVCWLCGMPIDYAATKNTTDDSFNLDHLYPVSKHPELQFDPAGFKPSHTSCNRLRSNQDPPTPIGTLSRQWIKTA